MKRDYKRVKPGKPHTQETRQKLSAIVSERWRDPKFRDRNYNSPWRRFVI